jgi:hypothetical protein
MIFLQKDQILANPCVPHGFTFFEIGVEFFIFYQLTLKEKIMGGHFKEWPYPGQCPNCSGAAYDKTFKDTPYCCHHIGDDCIMKAQGNPKAPLACGDYREGKMRISENMGYETKATTNEGKIMEGAGQILRNALNDEPISADEFVAGAGKIAVGAVGALFSEEKVTDADRARYAQESIENINSVKFKGKLSAFFGFNKLKDEFSSIMNYQDNKMPPDTKMQLADMVISNMGMGVGFLQSIPNGSPKQLLSAQKLLYKTQVGRAALHGKMNIADEEYNKNNAIIDNAVMDSNSAFTSHCLDTLFQVKSSLFGLMGEGKVIPASGKCSLSAGAMQKITEGIASLKQDAGFNQKKIAQYEAELENFRIERNGITCSKDEEFNAAVGRTVVSNVSLNGSSKFIEAGLSALLSVKSALFGVFGAGKSIFSGEKKEICDAAIQKLREGIELLKKDAGFDAKKLAKLQENLADFETKAQTIKKTDEEKAAEKKAEQAEKDRQEAESLKKELADIGNEFKDVGKEIKDIGNDFKDVGNTLKDAFSFQSGGKEKQAVEDVKKEAGKVGGQLKDAFGGVGKGLGGLFGKK